MRAKEIRRSGSEFGSDPGVALAHLLGLQLAEIAGQTPGDARIGALDPERRRQRPRGQAPQEGLRRQGRLPLGGGGPVGAAPPPACRSGSQSWPWASSHRHTNDGSGLRVASAGAGRAASIPHPPGRTPISARPLRNRRTDTTSAIVADAALGGSVAPSSRIASQPPGASRGRLGNAGKRVVDTGMRGVLYGASRRGAEATASRLDGLSEDFSGT
jgi:hypothetical protein